MKTKALFLGLCIFFFTLFWFFEFLTRFEGKSPQDSSTILNELKYDGEGEEEVITEDESWKFPGLFHFTHFGLRIQGAISVTYETRHGLFNFNTRNNWLEQKPCGNLAPYYTWKNGCQWCSKNDQVCSEIGTLTVTRQEDSRTKIHKSTITLVKTRSYSQNRTEYKPMYRAINIECKFNNLPPIEASKEIGSLKFVGNEVEYSRFRPLVNRWKNKRMGREMDNAIKVNENVVCSRGIFGSLDPLSIVRFTKFYTERWNFQRVIIYLIGLDYSITSSSYVYPLSQEPIGAEMEALKKSGKLILVDLREEFQRLYGYQAMDVTLFTANVLQMVLKSECLSRSRGMEARWTLHVDLDEYLFQSKPTSPSIHKKEDVIDILTNQFHFPNSNVWYSFSLTTVEEKDSILCSCDKETSSVFNWEKFVSKGNQDFLHELELTKDNKFGPFLNRDNQFVAQYGKRKILVRVDNMHTENELQVNGLQIHKLHPNCAFQNNTKTRSVGADTDPFLHFHLREYTCTNLPMCNKATEYQWFN